SIRGAITPGKEPEEVVVRSVLFVDDDHVLYGVAGADLGVLRQWAAGGTTLQRRNGHAGERAGECYETEREDLPDRHGRMHPPPQVLLVSEAIVGVPAPIADGALVSNAKRVPGG